MKAALAAAALIALSTAPATAQTWSSYGQGSYGQGYDGQSRPYGSQAYSGPRLRTWSSRGYGYGDYDGQQDRPGDYRCDAYWDRGRDDCDASWRDQRSYRGSYGYGGREYGYGHGGYRNAEGGGYVYQPYNQGTQYYGAYGRPDQVYPGSGYGGRVGTYSYGGYGQGYRDPNRTAWCAAQYRSYDPNSGFYRAYSGRLVFCG